MTASREASSSARFRLSSPSRRSPARHANGDDDRGDAEDDEAGAQRRPRDQHRSEHGAQHHRGHRQRLEHAHDATQHLGSHDAGERRLRDHLAGDEAGAAEQGHQQRDRELGRPRIRELRGAEHCAGDDDDARDLRARREPRVDCRAQQPTQPGDGQQVAVAGGAGVEPARGVEDELNGLGAVGELRHGDDREERYDERRGARGVQPVHQLGAHALDLAACPRGPRGAASSR